MRVEDCFFLGTITRKHGKEGGLVVVLDTDQPQNYYKMESVFLLLNGELVPFFFKEITPIKEDQLRVFFEDFSPRETDKLIGTELFLPLSFLPPLDGKKFYYHEIENFIAHDEALGEIGTITHVQERASQPLIVINNGQQEMLIPAIDEFIKSIDRDKKVMYFRCPEGLISLNG